jgi:hypothetical protein
VELIAMAASPQEGNVICFVDQCGNFTQKCGENEEEKRGGGQENSAGRDNDRGRHHQAV